MAQSRHSIKMQTKWMVAIITFTARFNHREQAQSNLSFLYFIYIYIYIDDPNSLKHQNSTPWYSNK